MSAREVLAAAEWNTLAKCRTLAEDADVGDVDADLFFPDKGGDAPLQAQKAKDICTGNDGRPACPVLMECREWGIAMEHHGIWGGLSEPDRNVVRKQRERARLRGNKKVVRIPLEETA